MQKSFGDRGRKGNVGARGGEVFSVGGGGGDGGIDEGDSED